MSNTALHTVEDPVRCDLSRRSPMSGAGGSDCFLKRFSQWFWSAWMIAGTETRDALTDSANRSRDGCSKKNSCAGTLPSSQMETTAPGLQDQSSENPIPHSHPCKACQAWGVNCDRQKPRCSHCLDQQILCFYVAPARRSTKRSIKSQSAYVEVMNSSPGLLAN
ncbi:hypothetical protein BO71DRAFT_384816 [Aspergillus ellipticus CBS 707.79]|uniref:Zn(2)-C6 fungal-type domain-containing protein n=1 Tax=Aspergillus ellipticus CBS 707.79 TaxID=1448320 RepID=A0A319D3T6_9EURO|nr:hypothetical protein BO71DRAFT_384816 [Aspergillus ellipticus CBS 707.79]